jgi:hypothetical protein
MLCAVASVFPERRQERGKSAALDMAQGQPIGFRVTLSFCPGMDEMWESLSHEALFADIHDAKRLVQRIQRARSLNLSHWVWCPSPATPFGALQEKPTATLSKVPLPPSQPRLSFLLPSK